jgi:hypothetical protein
MIRAVSKLVGGQKVAKITVGTPNGRNGKRNGLKIMVLAISKLCAAYQILRSLPG